MTKYEKLTGNKSEDKWITSQKTGRKRKECKREKQRPEIKDKH